jgi:hypothetical protein
MPKIVGIISSSLRAIYAAIRLSAP